MTGDNPGSSGLFCFGMGYCAQALAKELKNENWSISGTVRSTENEAASKASKVDSAELINFDGSKPIDRARETLAHFSHLLVSVPPGPAGDPVLSCHRDAIEKCQESGTLDWIGYLSTTGVYGDHRGEWVDENTAPAPTSDRTRYRLDAERAWLDLVRDKGARVHIFRLAGIYGPGRNPMAALRAGTAHRIHKPGQVFSRIHVDDVVKALRASMVRPRPGAIYNVCDDEPAPPEDVVSFAAQLLGKEPPPLIPFADANLSAMARSFYADNKRVSNNLIKTELGCTLTYPTYREGLGAIAATDGINLSATD